MAIKLIEFPAQIPFHWWKTFWAIEGGTSMVDGRFTCIVRLKDDRLCLVQEVPSDFPGENRDFQWRRCWWIASGVDFPPYVVQYRRPFRGGGLYIVKECVDSPPLAGPFESLRLAFVALELLS